MRRTNKPVVKNNGLFSDVITISTAESIPIGSGPWFAWLANHNGFVYEGSLGHFTARSELRRGIRYWYGHRRREGKLTKTYLGKSEELTHERLEHANAILAGQMPVGRLLSNGTPGDLIAVLSPSAAAAIPSVGALAEVSYLPLTKFRPPALPQRLIARPRLTQRIKAPATVISAASGFGKTTLVNEWRQVCGKPVAWVALSAADNQPQRFWSTVVMALQAIDPSIGDGWLSQLHSSSPPSLLVTITDLTNDIVRVTEQIDASGICLVLDDYHHIQLSELHSSLQTWLEQIPAKFQLVITSNFKLPLSLGYLRANGTVVELMADDLRFTLEEGVDFLKQHTPGQPLAESDMQTLVKRTEGWVAGLVLAASVLSQQANRSKVMEIFTGAHLFLREFFMESVLHQQCEEVQKFLLKTSILEQLTGPLCDAMTGRFDGDEMLDRLWEESLFLERLEKPGWYRYHEMFSEMLRIQLREQFPTEIFRLHRKAARWYRAQNAHIDAIHHLLSSKSWEEAANLIEAVALSELEQLGEDSRLLRWLQQLPETVIHRHKTLLVVFLRLGRLVLPSKEVEDFLSRAETSLASMPISERTGVFQDTLKEIRRIRHLWASKGQMVLRFQAGKEDDTVGQMLDGILRCHRDSRLDLVKAEGEANKVYGTALARGHLFSILMAGGACANLAYSQGHLRRSEQIAHQVLRQASELRDKLPEPASIALTALSGVYFERNQLDQAQQLLERAAEVQPDPIGTNESINMAILRGKLQSMRGDHDAAFATIEAIRELYSRRPSSIWSEQDLAAYQALFRLHQGDLTSAARLLGEGWEVDQNPFSAFIRASILVQQKRNVAAEEILRYLINVYPHSFYWVPILRARVMLSLALFDQQKLNQARQAMAEAARIAAPEFFVRPFFSSDPPITSLLSLVLHTEDLNPGTRSFIKGTLTMLGHAEGAQKSSRDDPLILAIAASISPREQEILQSLSIGLSNRDIAERYSISASTVKTHLENIFRKLDINSRTQAIAYARELGLV